MQKLQGFREDSTQSIESGICGRVLPLFICKSELGKLYIPVTELIPDKVVDFLYGDAKLIAIHVLGDFTNNRIQSGQNPAVSREKFFLLRHPHTFLRKIHHDEAAGVPDLVGEITAGLDLLHIEAHVIARRVACHKSQTKRVSPVLVDDFKRIDAVAQRLAHLAAECVADKTVDQNVMERTLTSLLIAREDHADDPEENDVITGDKNVSRVEILHLRCLFRPAER